MTREHDLATLIRKGMEDHEKERERAAAQKAEMTAIANIANKIDNIGQRLDKINSHFCSRFPELCVRIEKVEEAVAKRYKR